MCDRTLRPSGLSSSSKRERALTLVADVNAPFVHGNVPEPLVQEGVLVLCKRGLIGPILLGNLQRNTKVRGHLDRARNLLKLGFPNCRVFS